MKKTSLILLILPSLFLTSCNKEDGNIADWIGEYRWVANYLEHWNYSLGQKTLVDHNDYVMEKTTNLTIQEDKTWHFFDSKGPGKSGQIRCYKNHINLLGMQNDYLVADKFAFIHKIEGDKTYINYTEDTSINRHADHYDYTIRTVYFIKIK